MSLSPQLDAREWTNKDGKTIEADFMRAEGDHVILKVKSKEHRVAIAELSGKDQIYLEELAASEPKEDLKEEPKGADFPLKLNQWVHGPEIDTASAIGQPIVLHQWQAHCQNCPRSLADFEKLARRKKKVGATFLIWHGSDKIKLAVSKADEIDLRLPVYHGKSYKWDKTQFGEFVWPHVVILTASGDVHYMGKADRKFEAALKEVLKK